jgi:hypothetical protein
VPHYIYIIKKAFKETALRESPYDTASLVQSTEAELSKCIAEAAEHIRATCQSHSECAVAAELSRAMLALKKIDCTQPSALAAEAEKLIGPVAWYATLNRHPSKIQPPPATEWQ